MGIHTLLHHGIVHNGSTVPNLAHKRSKGWWWFGFDSNDLERCSTTLQKDGSVKVNKTVVTSPSTMTCGSKDSRSDNNDNIVLLWQDLEEIEFVDIPINGKESLILHLVCPHYVSPNDWWGINSSVWEDGQCSWPIFLPKISFSMRITRSPTWLLIWIRDGYCGYGVSTYRI